MDDISDYQNVMNYYPVRCSNCGFDMNKHSMNEPEVLAKFFSFNTVSCPDCMTKFVYKNWPIGDERESQ